MTEATRGQWKRALKHAAFYAAYALAFVLVWFFVCRAVRNDYIFPSLLEILRAMGKLFGDAFFYSAFLQTLWRAVRAFLFSFLSAAVFAALAKAFPLLEKILAPLVTALRALPTLAIVLILLIWSTPARAPVIVAFIALFPLLYTGIRNAFSTVDSKLVEMCEAYKVPFWKRIWKMYLPVALPYILREAAGGAAFALKLVVSAEILASTYISVGGILQLSQIYLDTPRTFALTLLVIATGLLLEGLGALLASCAERRLR